MFLELRTKLCLKKKKVYKSALLISQQALWHQGIWEALIRTQFGALFRWLPWLVSFYTAWKVETLIKAHDKLFEQFHSHTLTYVSFMSRKRWFIKTFWSNLTHKGLYLKTQKLVDFLKVTFLCPLCADASASAKKMLYVVCTGPQLPHSSCVFVNSKLFRKMCMRMTFFDQFWMYVSFIQDWKAFQV